MEVFFATSELARRLGTERSRVSEFGVEAARAIDLRMQQLLNVPTLEYMRSLPGRCHELDSNPRGHLAIYVRRPLRLVFKPNTSDRPMPNTGSLDWASVDSIVITDINQRLMRTDR